MFSINRKNLFRIIVIYRTIGNIEQYVAGKNDYKLGSKMNLEYMSYDIQEKKDIWGMFLCGVKGVPIRSQLVPDKFKCKRSKPVFPNKL